jgi:hypothetical protein
MKLSAYVSCALGLEFYFRIKVWDILKLSNLTYILGETF